MKVMIDMAAPEVVGRFQRRHRTAPAGKFKLSGTGRLQAQLTPESIVRSALQAQHPAALAKRLAIDTGQARCANPALRRWSGQSVALADSYHAFDTHPDRKGPT
jgi:hypothetical protein